MPLSALLLSTHNSHSSEPPQLHSPSIISTLPPKTHFALPLAKAERFSTCLFRPIPWSCMSPLRIIPWPEAESPAWTDFTALGLVGGTVPATPRDFFPLALEIRHCISLLFVHEQAGCHAAVPERTGVFRFRATFGFENSLNHVH